MLARLLAVLTQGLAKGFGGTLREDIKITKQLLSAQSFRTRNAHRRRLRDECQGRFAMCEHVEVSGLKMNETELQEVLSAAWLAVHDLLLAAPQ